MVVYFEWSWKQVTSTQSEQINYSFVIDLVEAMTSHANFLTAVAFSKGMWD